MFSNTSQPTIPPAHGPKNPVFNIPLTVGYLIMSTALGTLLIPFLAGVFYFSTKKQRRTPMFTFVVLSVISAIGQAAFYMTITIFVLCNFNLKFLDYDSRGEKILIAAFAFVPNLLVDFALMCRVLAVYPRPSTPARRFWMVLAPLIIFKAARVACWVIVAHETSRPLDLPDLAQTRKFYGYIMERTVTLIDNSYASLVFLHQLSLVTTLSKSLTPNSFSKRVRTLLWIALSSFALPVPLFLVQLVLAAAALNANTFHAGEITQMISNFVGAICVAFATIWAAGTFSRNDIADHSARSNAIRFRRTSLSELDGHQEFYFVGTLPPGKGATVNQLETAKAGSV